MKYLAILFIVLFFCSLPSILSNIKGKGLDIYAENPMAGRQVGLMRISLANLPITEFDTQALNEK